MRINETKRNAPLRLSPAFFWMTQRMSCLQTAQAAGEKLLSLLDPEVARTVATDASAGVRESLGGGI